MAKKRKGGKDAKYFKISRSAEESPEWKKLSGCAVKLFVHLCNLRNKLTCYDGKNNPDHTFWRTETQLIEGTGMPRNSIRNARKELVAAKFLYVDISDKSFLRRFGPKYTICDDVYQKEMDNYRDKDALRRAPGDVDGFPF